MSVSVSEDFKRGFILDEERIRKVADLIKERFEKTSESYSLAYNIHREDGLDFQTDDVQQVISEQNTVGQRIRRLNISCHSKDFKVRLTLDSETGFFARGVQVSIQGTDRDSVYLMASELREYIRTGLATGTTRTMPLRIAASVLVLVLCSLVAKTMIHLRPSSTALTMEAALKSQDIQRKLNYLIQGQDHPVSAYTVSTTLIFLASILALAFMWTSSDPAFLHYLFPKNVFVFGAEAVRYRKRVSIR